MTDQEAVAHIVSGWLREIAPSFIMVQLVCLGYPARTAEVMAVIKAYIDSQSENHDPHA